MSQCVCPLKFNPILMMYFILFSYGAQQVLKVMPVRCKGNFKEITKNPLLISKSDLRKKRIIVLNNKHK